MQYITGFSISIFLVFLLLLKRKNKADWILIYWLLAVAAHIGLYYLDYSQKMEDFDFLTGFSIPFPLLHGPFLFSYTSLLLNPKRKAYLINLFLIPFYRLPASEKLFVFQNEGVGYENFIAVNAIIILLSGILYSLFSYYLVYKHKHHLKHQLARIEGKTLDWLKFLSLGLAVVWIFVILGENDWIFSCVVLFVILIGVFGIRQGNVFVEPVINMPHSNTKYEKSGLDERQKNELISNLEDLIAKEKPYLNPDLSLQSLSARLNTQANYLSQLLNDYYETSFYDYINSKRIEEFCSILESGELEHYKLVEIAYKCGFSSKSTFNRNFKRFKGKTPSQYKNEVK